MNSCNVGKEKGDVGSSLLNRRLTQWFNWFMFYLKIRNFGSVSL